MNMKKAKRGFTLLELMIIVAIIGILTVVAIPAYDVYIGRAQVAEALDLLRGLKTPVQEYYANTGNVPDIDDLNGFRSSGKYVQEITKDPLSSNKYVAVMKDGGTVNPSIAAMEIEFIFNTATGDWTCSGPTDKQSYLPPECRAPGKQGGML